jgi:hypothetical protein
MPCPYPLVYRMPRTGDPFEGACEGTLAAHLRTQFRATHAVRIDGVSLRIGSQESPRSRLT